MKILFCLPAAVSLYSKIPVPQKLIKEDSMKGCIAFLPVIGFIISILEYYVNQLATYLSIPLCARAAVFILIPLIVTGGFHVDGFMDTCDAKNSYASKERKLEILSDPHIGAFSVICLSVLLLAAFAAACIVTDRGGDRTVTASFMVFPVSRSMAAISSMCMKKAKDSGMLVTETSINNTVIYCILVFQLALSVAVIAFVSPVFAVLTIAAVFLFTLYYMRMTLGTFGGVTGDTAGYFVTVFETFLIAVFAAASLIF